MVELRGEYNKMIKIKLNPIVDQYQIIYSYTYSTITPDNLVMTSFVCEEATY